MTFRLSNLPFDLGALTRVPEAVRRRGILPTANAILAYLEDIRFDIRHGVKTVREVKLQELDVADVKKEQALGYRGIRASSFRDALRSMSVPRDGTFVDLGCGKGRALVLALEYGFTDAVGVEFSAELSATARENLALYCGRRKNSVTARVLHADAAEYVPDNDDQVFFLFHPFGPEILERVLANIEKSHDNAHRRLYLLYANPVHRNVIEARSFWACTEEKWFVGFGSIVLYQAG